MKLKDLAAHLDLSITTVSRGLSGYREVNEKTRQRILEVAKELNYIPSSFALSLKKGRTNLIGLLIPYSLNSYEDLYCQSLASAVSLALSEFGYSLVITGAQSEEKELENLRRLVKSKTVDGMILVRTRLNDRKIKFMQDSGLPYVCHGKTEDTQSHCYVDSDGEKGHKLATGRLIRYGHTRIAWLGNFESFFAAKVRLQGYKAALKMYGIPFDENLCRFGDILKSSGMRFTRELMALPDPPTAFVCISDIIALGVMEEIKNIGLKIGSNISIIGYDDFPIAKLMGPTLTSVNSNFQHMGRKLTEFIVKRIEGVPVEELQIITDVSISSRQSDGPLILADKQTKPNEEK